MGRWGRGPADSAWKREGCSEGEKLQAPALEYHRQEGGSRIPLPTETALLHVSPPSSSSSCQPSARLAKLTVQCPQHFKSLMDPHPHPPPPPPPPQGPLAGGRAHASRRVTMQGLHLKVIYQTPLLTPPPFTTQEVLGEAAGRACSVLYIGT